MITIGIAPWTPASFRRLVESIPHTRLLLLSQQRDGPGHWPCADELACVDLLTIGIDATIGSRIQTLWRCKPPGNPPYGILAIGERVDLRHVVDAVQAGALDVLDLCRESTEQLRIARRAVEHTGSVRLRHQPDSSDGGNFAGFEFHGPLMQSVIQVARRVAPTNTTVLVTGESGTGKEVLARAIHRTSRRADRRFVGINCAGMTPSLVESELFGHERGSFTGALRNHRGCFERAAGGTLLLDEIGELPLELQSKLLRVLQERTFIRVGGETDLPVDCRIIATTNRDLARMVTRGEFRQDLYYRLRVVAIHLPPLRERPECVLPLTRRFIHEFCDEHRRGVRDVTESARLRLQSHRWPGNVRELRNTIESAVALAAHDELTLDDVLGVPGPPLPGEATPHPSATCRCCCAATHPADHVRIPVGLPLREVEEIVIQATLEACSHNRERTARTLGIGLRTLYRRLQMQGDAS